VETPEIAKPFKPFDDGDAPYQQRGRAALPVLVRQANARARISYAELAEELGISNPRVLNYPLGSVGNSLIQLSEKWGQKIPPIQCLVVNQKDGLPGTGGVNFFVPSVGAFKGLPLRKRQDIVEGVLAEVFAYPRWNEVLDFFGLERAATGYERVIEAAAGCQGGGESEPHKALKRYVAENPRVVDLPARAGVGEMEHALPSGDSIDVYFPFESVRTAVEVKARISDHADITRGLFQCIKYRAVLRAWIAAENSDDATDAILVLEGKLPDDLRSLRNILDVKVVENAYENGTAPQ
jgi:hypothetical protein